MEIKEKNLIKRYGKIMYIYGESCETEKILKKEPDKVSLEFKIQFERRLEEIKKYSSKASKCEYFYNIIKDDLEKIEKFYEKSNSYIRDTLWY